MKFASEKLKFSVNDNSLRFLFVLKTFIIGSGKLSVHVGDTLREILRDKRFLRDNADKIHCASWAVQFDGNENHIR